MKRAVVALVVLAACGEAAPTPVTPATADVHDHPTRDEVMFGLHEVVGPIRACGRVGTTVSVRMTFVSDGHVAEVSVPPGAPFATCIAEAASRARVPPFSQARFFVTYPFAL